MLTMQSDRRRAASTASACSWYADVHLRIVGIRVTCEAVCCKDLGDLSYIQQEKQRAQYGALWDTEQEVEDF